MMLKHNNCLCLITLLLASFQITFVYCEGWAWISGDKIVDQVSTYQYPGERSGASTWHDVNVNLTWMFGGQGFSEFPSGKPHLLNDLWIFNFNPVTEAKEKMDYFVKLGPVVSTGNSQKEIKPWPGIRQHASMCGFSDSLILFSGLGENGTGLEDLWIFNLRDKTWRQMSKKGPSRRGHPGVWCFGSFMYIFGGLGEKGQILNDMWKLNMLTLEWTLLQPFSVDMELPFKADLPEGRNGPATWVSGGAFYMFGGNTASSFSYSMQLVEGLVSDMWRYFPCNSTWDRVKDPMITDNKKIHNHMDAEKDAGPTIPGPRIGAGSWVDSLGNLWLFGGAGSDASLATASKHSQVLSDIWRFNTKPKVWEFVGGSREGGKAGIYTNLGEETVDGLPGSRTEMMVFPGKSDKIYIFGGVGHDGRKVDGFLNDLWSLDVSSVMSYQYMISVLSLLLFLGVGIFLLIIGFVVGLSSREDKHHGLMNRLSYTAVRSGLGASGHQYKQLKTDSEFIM